MKTHVGKLYFKDPAFVITICGMVVYFRRAYFHLNPKVDCKACKKIYAKAHRKH